MQIINLAAKLYLTNHKQTKLLCSYVLNLAKSALSCIIMRSFAFLSPPITISSSPELWLFHLFV